MLLRNQKMCWIYTRRRILAQTQAKTAKKEGFQEEKKQKRQEK